MFSNAENGRGPTGGNLEKWHNLTTLLVALKEKIDEQASSRYHQYSSS